VTFNHQLMVSARRGGRVGALRGEVAGWKPSWRWVKRDGGRRGTRTPETLWCGGNLKKSRF